MLNRLFLPGLFEEQYGALRTRDSHVDVVAILSPEAAQEAEAWLASIEVQVQAGHGEH
jgi:hypothetical protein